MNSPTITGLRLLALLMLAAAMLAASIRADSPESSRPVAPEFHESVAVRLPDVPVPYSGLASKEAKRNLLEFVQLQKRLKALPPSKSIEESRRRIDTYQMIPGLERLRAVFKVTITPEVVGGVQTDIVLPASEVSRTNRRRVLLNLHGGGFVVGARYGGQLESVPIASLGAIKVITVDYRMAPALADT